MAAPRPQIQSAFLLRADYLHPTLNLVMQPAGTSRTLSIGVPSRHCQPARERSCSESCRTTALTIRWTKACTQSKRGTSASVPQDSARSFERNDTLAVNVHPSQRTQVYIKFAGPAQDRLGACSWLLTVASANFMESA